jgi:hypothetical protein
MICLLVAGVIIALLTVITTIVVVRYKKHMGKRETNPGNIAQLSFISFLRLES